MSEINLIYRGSSDMGKKKKKYPKEVKESVLKRLMAPTTDTVKTLSEELGIPKTTIYEWKRKNNKKTNNPKPVNKWTTKDKFQALLETARLTEREIAQYCRRKGIYVNDINSWEEQFLKADTSNLEDSQKLKKDLKEEKDKIKKLEKGTLYN